LRGGGFVGPLELTGVLAGVQAELGSAQSPAAPVLAALAALTPSARAWRGAVRPAGEQTQKEHAMSLQVSALSIELIEALRPLMARIKARDKSLADQIQRAASSIALNLGEGEYSDPGNRRARYFTAAGSAGETLSAVRVAVAWRYIDVSDGEVAVRLLTRILQMTWKLTRG
jgi:four helix bundle protein